MHAWVFIEILSVISSCEFVGDVTLGAHQSTFLNPKS